MHMDRMFFCFSRSCEESHHEQSPRLRANTGAQAKSECESTKKMSELGWEPVARSLHTCTHCHMLQLFGSSVFRGTRWPSYAQMRRNIVILNVSGKRRHFLQSLGIDRHSRVGTIHNVIIANRTPISPEPLDHDVARVPAIVHAPEVWSALQNQWFSKKSCVPFEN